MIIALIFLPALTAIVAFLIRRPAISRILLLLSSLTHTALVILTVIRRPKPVLGGWLSVDPIGLVFLSITSLLFLFSSIYAFGYLALEQPGNRSDIVEGGTFSNEPEGVFIGCLLLFLSSMTAVTLSHHLGLLWIGVETTTLASAPLIYFHRHHRSLEAAWKYLLICSLGIGLALIGNLFIAVATKAHAEGQAMMIEELVLQARGFDPLWLKIGFIFMLVGYGTKMGLVPMHSWLPDAHSESPSVVSALLSGALLNCAFLGILRGLEVLVAAGYGGFGKGLLLVFGLLSMAVAAIFIVTQFDFKRLLAYSSIEHMGILALGVGIGGVSVYGSLLHAINHSLVKASLFMVAGNLLRVFKTKDMQVMRGVIHSTPWSGALWMVGFFAILGSPPFGLFVSEFTILRGALENGHLFIPVLYLAILGGVFVGMVSSLVPMVQGVPTPDRVEERDYLMEVIPPTILLAMALILGLYVPDFITINLEEAARTLGGM